MNRNAFCWLCAYLIVVVMTIHVLANTRLWALEQLSTTAVQTDWERWRKDAQAQDGSTGPVARRPVKSHEPPALVLLRDYFFTVLAGVLLFISSLFTFFMFALRGVWKQKARKPGNSAH